MAKDAPQKRSFVVFFEIYGRKFWNLMLAGLLFLLVNIPLITRGWADAGLTFITRSYAREKHAFLREDFFETIRKNRGQAFWCGIINLLVTGLMLFNLTYYAFALNPGLYGLLGVDTSELAALSPSLIDYAVMAASMMGYVLFTWMKYYIPFLLITFKLRTKQIYKNAFIFAAAGLKQNLLISVILIALYALPVGIVLLIPNMLTVVIMALLCLLLYPGFRSLLIQFTVFPVIKKLMIDPYYRDNPDADKQARLDLNLDVEEPAAAQEESVFSDTLPVQPEETSIPRQYTEQEMRRFSRRIQSNEDDDDTI